MVSVDGWERAFKYAGCAAAIAFAATTQTWVMAVIACAALMAEALDR